MQIQLARETVIGKRNTRRFDEEIVKELSEAVLQQVLDVSASMVQDIHRARGWLGGRLAEEGLVLDLGGLKGAFQPFLVLRPLDV